MNYKGIFVAMAIVDVVMCSVFGIVLVERNNIKTGIDLTATSVSTETATQFAAETQEDNQVSEVSLPKGTEYEGEPIATETPAPNEKMQIDTPTDKITQPEYFAELTIKTFEKTGTYKVMPDVNEDTLKDNIGWLPYSSLPGEEGLCILMGHRDTDFKILKYIKLGDEITVEYGNSSCVYKVTKVDIVNNDDELRFSVMSGSNLSLLTCYPFYFVGHAPKKIVVKSVLINKIK